MEGSTRLQVRSSDDEEEVVEGCQRGQLECEVGVFAVPLLPTAYSQPVKVSSWTTMRSNSMRFVPRRKKSRSENRDLPFSRIDNVEITNEGRQDGFAGKRTTDDEGCLRESLQADVRKLADRLGGSEKPPDFSRVLNARTAIDPPRNSARDYSASATNVYCVTSMGSIPHCRYRQYYVPRYLGT